MYAELLLSLLLPVTLVSAWECCSGDLPTVHINGTFYCLDEDWSRASVYDYCFRVQTVDPKDPDLDFKEDEDQTHYSVRGEEWLPMFCRGPFTNVSESDDNFRKYVGKELVLICADEELPEKHHSLYAICLLISCVFLLLTLVIYLILPELRDLQGKCVMCFILSLIVGYLLLAYLKIPFTSPSVNNEMKCVLTAFVTYFSLLSAFFWLNVNSFNLWRSARLSHIRMSESKLMLCYYFAGWGLPLCFVIVALTTHNMPGENIVRPNFGVQSCWFEDKLELWSFFYGPVSAILILNTLYFIDTARFLWINYRRPDPIPRIMSLRIRFCLYMKLFLLMGIPWIFEILSSLYGIWYLTDIINCLQGVIIFGVMVVFRKRVWRALAAHRFCGIQVPHFWERIDDDEETANDVVDEQPL